MLAPCGLAGFTDATSKTGGATVWLNKLTVAAHAATHMEIRVALTVSQNMERSVL